MTADPWWSDPEFVEHLVDERRAQLVGWEVECACPNCGRRDVWIPALSDAVTCNCGFEMVLLGLRRRHEP